MWRFSYFDSNYSEIGSQWSNWHPWQRRHDNQIDGLVQARRLFCTNPSKSGSGSVQKGFVCVLPVIFSIKRCMPVVGQINNYVNTASCHVVRFKSDPLAAFFVPRCARNVKAARGSDLNRTTCHGKEAFRGTHQHESTLCQCTPINLS